ncbi:MAG: hypothetical protein KIT22_14690 [Verrucomicrobiae bacterium]|nr:hypothetical protein [Verrucomicrobiae bacterium]
MSPLAEAVIVLTARYGPVLVEKLVAIANKPKPTPEEWAAVFKEIRELDYDAAIREAAARAEAKAA